MEETKRILTEEEMEQATGGCMPTCFHPTLSRYLGKTDIRCGERSTFGNAPNARRPSGSSTFPEPAVQKAAGNKQITGIPCPAAKCITIINQRREVLS